jgi:DNA-binding response OmpR family regulator
MTPILIVEDDEGLRFELTDYLVSLGYTVRGVGSLAAAELLLHLDFALVLLDINLPDGSGMDFCLRIRPYVRAGIVIMTGRSERELRIQGLNVGVDAYLVKPVDPEELDATLKSVLRRMSETRFSMVKAAPMPVQWRVDHLRMTLSGPNGKTSKLSKGETFLLVALIQAERQQTSRAQLLASFDAQGASSSGHRVEALISRLRNKVMADIGLELPIHSIYGQGYAFVDHARII